ncbi:IS5 family transposase, partial [Streptomyces sp. WM6372]|uniref:IS5 family transposase n=1 Tax=Streptomyces sp. WM6372 TaxID=1415555 RepID=UPI001F40937B
AVARVPTRHRTVHGDVSRHHDPQPKITLTTGPSGGGARGEGLGRSRGGFTTKLHLSADGCYRPLSLVVTPGQRADCTQFKPVLEKIRVPKPGPGRPRKTPDSVAADKAYSNGPCRQCVRSRGIRHTIPEKADSQAARLRKGSRGGRPPGFDEERYKKRNTIERAINRLKQHRAVATRYDTNAATSTSAFRARAQGRDDL